MVKTGYQRTVERPSRRREKWPTDVNGGLLSQHHRRARGSGGKIGWWDVVEVLDEREWL